MTLVLSLLGPVQVTLDGIPLQLGGPRGRRVLAALALEAGRVVPTAGLAQAVWDDPPATAREQLQNAAGLLRRRLAGAGASVVRTDAGFLLDPGPAVLDVREFARLRCAAEAAAGPGAARELLVRALGLWRAPAALGGLRGRIFEAAAARLAQERIDCVERALAADIALGRHAEVCPELAVLTGEHPLRERLVELHMLALYRSGRRAEALTAFDSARRRLAREAGLDPGPELRSLHAAVLADAAELRGRRDWCTEPGEVPVRSGRAGLDVVGEDGAMCMLRWVADAQRMLGRPAEAAAGFREVLAHTRGSGDLAGQSAARIGLGRIALDGGDVAGALRQLRAADELGRRSGQSLVRVLAVEPLARALLASGEAGAARVLLREALASCRRMNARPLLARLESALAEVPA
ncbi:BTAD domain-containing putative transcriptional regulator [Streptomyces sp. 147326]|uniref:BTAD domain-containing putative transcriptional regulator n=1 Tax=Streptomyces sp. 147326 TaxID=3074379 RepID=UPI0038576A27